MLEYLIQWFPDPELPQRLHCGLYTLYVAMLILPSAPTIAFLCSGWKRRRDGILDTFDRDTSASYLKLFHSQTPPKDEAETSLETFYNSHFARHGFFAPWLLFVVTTTVLLYGCLLTVFDWLQSDSTDGGSLPLAVVAAILGGYTWVCSDQITRFGRDNIRPNDLNWATFRLVISVPMAYSLSLVINESLSVPISYLLGTFPTETVLSLGRKLASSKIPESALQVPASSESSSLRSLPAIRPEVIDRLLAEDITTVPQLAYADPVRLAIRTGLTYTYVTTLTCQALAVIYFQEHFPIAVNCGLYGGCEVRNLWENRKPADGDIEKRNQSNAVVTEIAKKSSLPVDVVLNVMREIAFDPHIEFYWSTWS